MCECYNNARTFAFRLDANGFAFLLSFESIVVTFAAAVPESRAASVLGVVEPLDGELATSASVAG